MKRERQVDRTEVVSRADGEVVHFVRIEGGSRKRAEKVEARMERNMDHERFFTRLVEKEGGT